MQCKYLILIFIGIFEGIYNDLVRFELKFIYLD